jgi:hypothetical protein
MVAIYSDCFVQDSVHTALQIIKRLNKQIAHGNVMFASLLMFLMACGETQPEPLYLTKEFYSWTCKDYEDHSELIVISETCEDRESGLWYLIAEVQLYTDYKFKRQLTQEVECHYKTSFVFIDEVCIEVEGVTLTAWVDEATWSGTLIGD